MCAEAHSKVDTPPRSTPPGQPECPQPSGWTRARPRACASLLAGPGPARGPGSPSHIGDRIVWSSSAAGLGRECPEAELQPAGVALAASHGSAGRLKRFVRFRPAGSGSRPRARRPAAQGHHSRNPSAPSLFVSWGGACKLRDPGPGPCVHEGASEGPPPPAAAAGAAG